MQEKQLLIIGVDPGTTLGYSILGINGNIIEVNSSKLLDLNSLITKLASTGKVIIIGTDKQRIPGFVEKLKRRLGARLIAPNEDLKITEKNKLILDYPIRNTHERDALSSAIFSYNKSKPLFTKIDSFLSLSGKREYSSQIKELLITRKDLNLTTALEFIENEASEKQEGPEKKASEREKEIIPKKRDYEGLHRKYSMLRKEFKLLKNYTDSINNELLKCKENYRQLRKEKISYIENKRAERLLELREKRIHGLNYQIRVMEKENKSVRGKVNNLHSFLSNLSGNILLKKLSTLGWDEFLKRNKILNIKFNDILLVENPNIASRKTLEHLKSLISVIIYKHDISKTLRAQSGFIFINSKELEIIENELFGLVDKKAFDEAKNNKSLLSNIIKEYRDQKER